MLETALETLATVSDEGLPGVSSPKGSDDIPSPISTSFSNTVFIYPPEILSPDRRKTSSPEIAEFRVPDAKTNHNSFAIDLILTYETNID